jgi:hypothetical protein
MKTIKHVGKIKNTGNKIAVVFRTVPGESDKCLVVQVTTLPDAYHDSMMTVIESEQAQDAFELGEILFMRTFPNGLNMLTALKEEGRLVKVSTDTVIMTPTPVSEISLDELNSLIAAQKNCTIDDLCNFVSGGKPSETKSKKVESKKEEITETVTNDAVLAAPTNSVLTDKDLAKSYRSQADAMYKEAAKLRKMAEELDPVAKKTKVKEEESV